MSPLIKEWEERNQQDLWKLAALIQKIIHVARRYRGNVRVEYNAGGDTISCYEYDGQILLPPDLYSKWDDRPDCEVEVKTKHDAGAESSVKSDERVRRKQKGKAPDLVQETRRARKPQ